MQSTSVTTSTAVYSLSDHVIAMSMLSDFAEAVDLFAKTRLNASIPVVSFQSSEGSRDMELSECKSGRSSVLSEISGLVRYMSHKEKVERGYEVLIEDYDGFHHKNAPFGKPEDDKSIEAGTEEADEDSLLQLLDDVDRMNGEKSVAEKSMSLDGPGVASMMSNHDREKTVDIAVPSTTSNTNKSVATQLSRKVLSTPSSLKEEIPEDHKEAAEDLKDPEDMEEKPQTIEIPKVASVASQESAHSLKSASATSMVVIQPIVSMLSMGSIKSIASMKSSSSIKASSSKKSRNSVILDSLPNESTKSIASADSKHKESVDPQSSMLSQASMTSRKSITFSDVVKTNEGKSEPIQIEKVASTLSKLSNKSAPCDVTMAPREEAVSHQVIQSQQSNRSSSSKMSHKSVLSFNSRKSRDSHGSASRLQISGADSWMSRGLTKQENDGIIIPPALSMQSNNSKASRKSIVSIASRKSKDSETPDVPAVQSCLSKKSLKSESERSMKSTGSKKSMMSIISRKSKDANAQIVSSVESSLSKQSVEREVAGSVKSSATTKSVMSMISNKSNDVDAQVVSTVESGLSKQSIKSGVAGSVKSSASSKSLMSMISRKSKDGNPQDVATVESCLTNQSNRSKPAGSVKSSASTQSVQSFKSAGSATVGVRNGSDVIILPPQLSMKSNESRSSLKDGTSVVSITLASLTENPSIDAVTVASDVSKKSSKSKNLTSNCSTVSKKSTFSGYSCRFLGEFPIEEQTREEAAEEQASVEDVIPSQVSMYSQGSKTSHKSIVSRLSHRKPDEEQAGQIDLQGTLSIAQVESSLSKKSSKSFASRILKSFSKVSSTADDISQDPPPGTSAEATGSKQIAISSE